MQTLRHLRRLRARWRLHRMEWAAMQRPMEPPPGYEEYHTLEEVFPGLRRKWNKMETFSDVVESFRKGWRFYKHTYIPDPEIEKWERDMQVYDERLATKKMWKIFKKGENFFNKGVERAEEVTDDFVEELEKQRPAAQDLMKNRVSVLKEALHEFAAGYAETASGAKTLWGDAPYDADLVREDNRPVLYRPHKESD